VRAILEAVNSEAAALPRVRRRRRPPKALVFLACTYALSLGWLADCVLGVLTGSSPSGVAIYVVVAALWISRSIRYHRQLGRVLRAFERDEKLPDPTPAQWGWLAFSGLLMAGVAVDILSQA
jgi:hypothetical protein